jgi:hypothetical protein
MSTKNLYRIGGIAALLSILLILTNVFYLEPDGGVTQLGRLALRISVILFVPIAWSLYVLYGSINRPLSLTSLILSIAGSISFFINWNLILPDEISSMFVFFFNALDFFIIPTLLFGILAFLYPQLGMPRILGIIGIASSILWIIFYFRDDTTYFILNPLNLRLVWFAWTGAVLLFGKIQESVKN